MAIDFKSEAEALDAELKNWRRDFHQHPELAFQEVRTSGIVTQVLNELELEVQTGIGKTGVVAILEGKYDGPTVLVRADMDALPIQEDVQLDFVSQNTGVMHACGHDGHTAIALGVAKLFTKYRDELHGRIKFVFQPAEEIGQGARAMVTDGAMQDPVPDVSLGLHLWNSLPVGKVGVADGPTMAGALIFEVVLTGKGGHAASPHMAIDPVVCAAQLVSAYQTIVSRNVDPFDTAVISVTSIKAGEGAYNVIPQTVRMVGTVRIFRTEVGEFVSKRMREITESLATAMGCKAEFKIDVMTRPVINDAETAQKVRDSFLPILPESDFEMGIRTMGAEDVSEFMSDVPGMYFFVGARDETADGYYGHHHPRFTIDEAALPLGVSLLSSAVAAYLLPES